MYIREEEWVWRVYGSVGACVRMHVYGTERKKERKRDRRKERKIDRRRERKWEKKKREREMAEVFSGP